MEKLMKKLTYILPVVVALLMISTPALAEGTGVAAKAGAGDAGWLGLGAGLAIGLSALGGALAQGNTAKAALEAIGRNPNANVLVPMVLGLALIESLVIYGMVVAFQLVGKI
jgi:F-type H+-transporting ATPase subunit c